MIIKKIQRKPLLPKFNNISLSPGADIEAALKKLDPDFKSYRILKQSLDARKKSKIMFIYSVETFSTEAPPPHEKIELEKSKYRTDPCQFWISSYA